MAVQRLLRRHEVQRPQDRVPIRRLGQVADLVGEAGEPQVQDLDDPRAVDQQVRRLDVPVDQAGLVGVPEPPRRLLDVMGRPERVHRPVDGDVILQVDPVDVRHHEEMQRAVLVDVVRRDDVRVVQLGDGPRLAAESLQRGGFAAPAGPRRQDLQRDGTPHDPVLAEVDAGHPAGPEPLQHLVLPADEEVALLAGQELLGLVVGQQAVADHQLGQLPRRARPDAGRSQPVQVGPRPPRLHQAAPLEEREELIDIGERIHAGVSSGRSSTSGRGGG